MPKARIIGGHIRIAYENLRSAKRIGLERRDSSLMMFLAVENLVLATFSSEDIDLGEVRARKGRNHHLDQLVEELPDACAVKDDLLTLSVLSAYSTTFRYPTPAGRVPKAPDQKQSQEWYDKAERVLMLFIVHFKVDMKQDSPVSGSVLPVRNSEPDQSPTFFS